MVRNGMVCIMYSTNFMCYVLKTKAAVRSHEAIQQMPEETPESMFVLSAVNFWSLHVQNTFTLAK